MPYLFVGTGQAGSAIVDDVFGHHRISTIASPLVFNSTIRDLQNLSNVGQDHWYGIAERHGLVPGDTPGFEERVTGGFGRNPVRAREVMEDHRTQLRDLLETRLGGPEGDADVPFAFVFLGLGGGTGCGIAPHVADAIKEFTDDVARVIAVAVLPNTEGDVTRDDDDHVSAGRQAWNAAFGLEKLEEAVDGIILVDNGRLAFENAAEGRFAEYNEYVASAIVDLISGPVLERIDPGEYDDIDPPVIDVQDVVTSLSFDTRGRNARAGYASLGRSVTMTKSMLGYLVPWVGHQSIDSAALARIATSKQTLVGADPGEARKAIGLVRAPAKYVGDPDYRVETSVIRRFLESKCSEVNLGVTLTRRNLASFTTLFTYERSEVDRIAEIEALADQYETETIPA